MHPWGVAPRCRMTLSQQILRKCRIGLSLIGALSTPLLPTLGNAAAPPQETQQQPQRQTLVPPTSRRVVAVATENASATRAAITILRRGGNAVDAAVAAALVTGVVAPSSSGLGGGGFALVWLAQSRTAQFLDFRERAPALLRAASMDARPLSELERGLLVGVPGEPSGLFELHSQHGRLAFSAVTDEAARLAEAGFPVSMHLWRMARKSGASSAKLQILHALGFDRNYFAAGSWARSPLLGRTLRRYGEAGPKALLEGEIGEDWVTAAREYGGVLSLADLRDYRPKARAPLRMSYGRFEVITAPPPSAGGLLLAQTLGTFSPVDLATHREPAARIHLLAEAYRASLRDRTSSVGDPDFVAIDVPALLSPERLRARRAAILANQSQHHLLPLPDEHGTTHIAVMDAEGNAVALTTTVNNAFGSKILGSKSGVVLNDELDDFGRAGTPNQPQPLARPVSSMTPTIVLDGDQVHMVLGGSGGMTIATNVTTTLLSILVDGMSPETAVQRPRFTLDPNTADLLLEEAFPERLASELQKRGQIVRRVPRGISAVQVIARIGSQIVAAADSRKYGSAEIAVIASDRQEDQRATKPLP